MIDTKKINERIAQNILSEAEYIYENYGEDAFTEYMEFLTEDQKTIFEETYLQGVKRRAGEILTGTENKNSWAGTIAGYGADILPITAIPRAISRYKRNETSGLGAAADIGLSALPFAGKVAKLAKGAYNATKAGKAAAAAATGSNVGIGRSAAAIKPPATAAAPSTLTKIPKKNAKAPATTPPAKPAVDPMAAKMATPTKPAVSPVAAGMASASGKGADDAIKAAQRVKATGLQKAAAIVGGAAVGAAAGSAENQARKDAADALKPTPNEQGRMAAAKAAPTTGDTRPQGLGPTTPTVPTATAPTKPVGPPGSRHQTSPGALTPTTKATKPAAPTQKAESEPKKEKTSTFSAPKIKSSEPKKKTFGFGKEGGADPSSAMGAFARSFGSVNEDTKPTIADFRMLQERIMRKSNGSF